MVIDGKKIAEGILENLKKSAKPRGFLAVFFVGENAASDSFIKQKEKIAKELGVDFRLYKFPENITQDGLRKEILKIAEHKTCGGAIIQLPLPSHINRQYVLNAISREKDVDVLGERALGAFYAGRNLVLPPAVGVVETILGIMNKELGIMNVTVIGAGFLVGKPISSWLENKVMGLNIFNEFTKDLRSKLKDADIIVSGVGKGNLFSAEDLKNGAIVIDFGYGMSEGKISGDFNPIIHNSEFLIHYTPTPGGTGPILVAKLFENFFKLNEK
ncbi:MAG: bifunctional 5,10-methylenetetrahydrofolate dehydrogenase/5,10-methenyltetrahydrofolate cyclohydrolase [Patescibacteria group bacterium]